VLGVLAGAALLGLRLLPALRTSLGSVLHGVERVSRGEFYFIVGVTLLFVLAGRNTALYVIPMLWLTFSDATAALIGLKYGTVQYVTHDGRKSLEGSLAFAIVTFMTTFIALVAFGHVNALADGLIAAIAAILCMLLEAVVWDGFDNFAIPIFGFALLTTLAELDAVGLVVRFVALAVLLGLTTWQRRRTSLLDEALLAAVLSGYALWVLGGWLWLIAPATLFLKDKLEARDGVDERRHDVHAVAASCTVGLALAVLNVRFPRTDWFFAYTLSFAITFALFDLTLSLSKNRSAAPFLLVSGISPGTMVWAALSLPIVFVCCIAFYLAQPDIFDCPRDAARWVRQTILAGAGTVLGCGLALAL
jgi:phytol kinase